MAWCSFLWVAIGVFILAVQDSLGQEYCSDLNLPLGELFKEHSKKQVKTGTSVMHRSIGRLEECLTKCIETDGCYGVDWNRKRRPPKNTKCWLMVGEVAEMETNKFVNHHRRLPCRQAYCSDLNLPLGELFEEHSKKQVKTGTSVMHRSIGRLEECLTKCIETDGCYGVDWNVKRRPPKRTKCWLVVGEVAEMETNKFVNHHRRLPCSESVPTEITTPAPQVDPCESLTCQNGGECKEATSGGASCDCADGFSGDSCEDALVTGTSTVGWSVVEREFSEAEDYEVYFMPHLVFEHAGTVTGIRYFWGSPYNIEQMSFATWRNVDGDGSIQMINYNAAPPPQTGENIIDTFYTEWRVEAGDSIGFFAIGDGAPDEPVKALPYDIGTDDQCSDTLHARLLDQERQEDEDALPYWKAGSISRLEDCRIYSVEMTYEPDA